MRIRAMINSANCLIYCHTRLTCPTRPKVCEALFILISHLSSPITNPKGKTFYSPWHIARCLEEPRDPTRGRGNVRNLAYLALVENDQIFYE